MLTYIKNAMVIIRNYHIFSIKIHNNSFNIYNGNRRKKLLI